jgi:CRISPR/Cas system CSM-associated protein Csm4 (group 5 of RAMP superfamily)
LESPLDIESVDKNLKKYKTIKKNLFSSFFVIEEEFENSIDHLVDRYVNPPLL